MFREDGLVSPQGGLDWFEGAIARPADVLEDLSGALPTLDATVPPAPPSPHPRLHEASATRCTLRPCLLHRRAPGSVIGYWPHAYGAASATFAPCARQETC